ncbi:MAG: response regulator [Candidatus Abyssubacteria bacterium]|nr:response regulator [Candidatus Abyssubacteria bacterium]
MSTQVRVLVVDDEEVVLKSVRRVLKDDDEHQFFIDTATSADEGLDLMARNEYDVVLTDLMMPGIDGLELIERIRQSDVQARIIMITGYATMRTALQALRKGAFDYIAKPFTKEELRSVVENAARQKTRAKTREAGSATGTATEEREDYRSFFNQTYARILADGTMYFGVETAFLETIGRPLSIELSQIGESVAQGHQFGSITNEEMRVFDLRAPLSGRVLEANREAIDNPSLIRKDPRGKGWLLRVEPTGLDEEAGNHHA